ncbi:hypothetical protein ACFQ1M_02365 [Sungkyunkwania multivorans]|uniref:CBM21 domain-containing protein n=1 Tax=Sungkyunkwania multivorans TaxID=1173618 RepID=A0ABW3CUS3_9FLAO
MTNNSGTFLNGIEVSYRTEDARITRHAVDFNVDVQNLSLEKSVKIVYTLDDWATVKEFELDFQQYYRVGYYNYLYSPNAFDVERWSGRLRYDTTNDPREIEFAVAYTVNGTTYWDSNYGQNYKLVGLF